MTKRIQYRYVVLLNDPQEFQFLRVEKTDASTMTICEVKLVEPGMLCILYC